MRRGQGRRDELAEILVDAAVHRDRSLARDAWTRFRRNRAAMVSVWVLAGLILFALIGPVFAAWPMERIDWAAAAAPRTAGVPSISTGHYFGTDGIGRDLYARTLQGLRISLAVGLLAACLAVAIGTIYGAVSGYVGGFVDGAMMRVVDFLVALPGLFILILILVMFDRSFLTLILGLCILGWLGTARIVRAQTLSLKEREFINAARVSGVGWFPIVLRHILPNLMGVVVVIGSMMVPGMIMAESFISFIGMGLQEPNTSLGKLISDGADSILSRRIWQLTYPLSIFVALMVALYFIGDGLRDAVDSEGPPGMSVLDIANLSVRFPGSGVVVADVSLSVEPGECLGVVGQSGSGKSQTFLAALQLQEADAEVHGTVMFGGRDLLQVDRKELNRVRGRQIGMIFQDPISSLTPHHTIGRQLIESLRWHRGMEGPAARAEALRWLDRLRLPDAALRFSQFPHELSGGMCQRAMIALAMINGPDLVIADEPTTALDTTTQAEILDLFAEVTAEEGAALVLVTHDMGVIARLSDRVVVMDRGRIVEMGPVDEVFHAPKAEETAGLIRSVPRLDRKNTLPKAALAERLLVADRLRLSHVSRRTSGVFRRAVRKVAVEDVSLSLIPGETLGIVGESGSGKTSVARMILGLVPPDGGQISWDGAPMSERRLRRGGRHEIQAVFQDPTESLDPRMTIAQSVEEPLRVAEPGLTRSERRARAADMLEQVELSRDMLDRFPHELSGGQNQRASIARAVVANPRLIVCDEAVSSLDASLQRGVLELLQRFQAAHGLAILFISHDMAVVKEISHRIAVMRRGRIVEMGPSEAVCSAPRHGYTQALIAAVPIPDPRIERGRSRVPLAASEQSGLAGQPLVEVAPGHFVSGGQV